MKKTIIFFVISVLALCFASCGEETSGSSSTGQYQQNADGTVFNRNVSAGYHKKTFQQPKFKKKWQLPPANIQTWPMVSTGQTQCYDNMQEIDCDSVDSEYSGQDGKTRFGTRSFSKEFNNEIVRDSVTSLLWTKKVNTNVTWYEAEAYCSSLRLNNKTWRLPTTSELRSIINYGKLAPAVDPVFYEDANGLSNSAEALDLKSKINNWFWATKHSHLNSENGTDLASSWVINFYDGFVEYTARYNKYNVRCVSSEF